MTQSLSRVRSIAGARVQLNSERENENTKAERRTTRRLQTLDVQLNSTRHTQATVSHNLYRDQHEISASFSLFNFFHSVFSIFYFPCFFFSFFLHFS